MTNGRFTTVLGTDGINGFTWNGGKRRDACRDCFEYNLYRNLRSGDRGAALPALLGILREKDISGTEFLFYFAVKSSMWELL